MSQWREFLSSLLLWWSSGWNSPSCCYSLLRGNKSQVRHFPAHCFENKSSPPYLEKAVIPAAVAVVAKLNTLLALPPLINKTSECLGRKGPASLPASHFPWTHFGHCAAAFTPQTRTHMFGFLPFGTSRRIPPSHLHWKYSCLYWNICLWSPQSVHTLTGHPAHVLESEAVLPEPCFNVWIIASSLIDVRDTKGKSKGGDWALPKPMG